MPKPLEIVTEHDGADERTSMRYSIGDFLILEQGTLPRQIYEYWLRLPRNENGLPDEGSCCPDSLFPNVQNLMGSWVETRSEDPLDYILREHEASEFAGYGTELSDRLLTTFPDSLHAFSCMAEYLYCKTDRQAVYHVIHQTTGGIKRSYTRIMLPVDGADGSVARIYYACRPITASVRIFPAQNKALEESR